jgi:hypothetical protein
MRFESEADKPEKEGLQVELSVKGMPVEERLRFTLFSISDSEPLSLFVFKEII